MFDSVETSHYSLFIQYCKRMSCSQQSSRIMKLKKQPFPSLFILLVALLCSSCIPKIYFKKAPLHIAYSHAPASILNRAYVSAASMRVLMGMEENQAPVTTTERVAYAEREIFRAKRKSKSSKELAAVHCLKAIETLWPVIKNADFPENEFSQGADTRILIAHQLYTYAVGQTVEYLISASVINPRQKTLQLGEKTLTINTASPNTIHPSFFDQINPLDTYRYGNVGAQHHKALGLGAATNGHRDYTSERGEKNPLMPYHGIDMPINVIVDYPEPATPRLTLTNLLKTDTAHITGETRHLSADYSASVAATMDSQASLLGLMVAMKPQKYDIGKGLFALGPFDPDKIPVIFIHGLVSQPSTWTYTSNYLLADKLIRENYQFYYYFYPTGVTPIISGAKLREVLADFYKEHDSEAHDKLYKTVLVGHSMGGILASIQSRQFDKKLWGSLFKESYIPHKDDLIYKSYHKLFDPPYLAQIKRTIFICTPHRGSELANGWIGRVGTDLIKVPKNIMTLQVGAAANSMTDLGRSIINADGRPNSINRLKPNNGSLAMLNQRPMSPQVTYHSIIGDRGKGNTPDSSDGVVPYWSSHLDGAASEKIVPTNHEAQLHEMTNQEIQRILHLHLKK